MKFASALLPVFVLAMAGCSAEPVGQVQVADPAVIVSPDTIVLDAPFARDVKVLPGRLLIPTAGHESQLGAISVGRVLVGRRSIEHPDGNPAGFLRRVTAVRVAGDNTEIDTTPAALTEAITQATFEVHIDPKRKATSTAPRDEVDPPAYSDGFNIDVSDIKLFDGALGSKDGPESIEASAKVVLDAAHFHLAPKFDVGGSIETHWGFPTGLEAFHASAGFEYDVSEAVTVSMEGKLASQRLPDSQKMSVSLLDGQVLMRDVFFVGPVPIEYAIKLSVDLECEAFIAGKSTVHQKARLHGSPTLGIEFKDGNWNQTGNPLDFNFDKEITFEREGAVGVRCGLPVKVSMDFYESVGPFISAGPYVELRGDVSSCPPPNLSWSAEVYGQLKLGAELNVLGKDLGSRYFSFDTEHVQVAGVEAPKCEGTKPPCEGVADGYYCGAEMSADPGKLFLCLSGKSAGEAPCPTSCNVDHGPPPAVTCN